MKVTPVTGSGVPAASNISLSTATPPDKIQRAKLIAAGQEVPETSPNQPSSGDVQVDKIKRIRMKTNASVFREGPPEAQVTPEEPVASPTTDTTVDDQEPAETRQIDPEVAAFLKAKRALQVKEREVADREKALEGKTQFNPEEYISKAELAANPLKVFEAGVTYDGLTEAILNNQNAPVDVQKIRAEIKEDIKKELLGEFGTRDQQAEQQVINQITKDILALTAQGEEFEAIRQAKAQDKVVKLIHRTFKETGEMLDETEAATLVENQLIDEALPFAKIKKFQSKINPEPTAQIPEAQRPNVKVMRTLTNRDNASPVMDKKQRAIAAFYGTLKKG